MILQSIIWCEFIFSSYNENLMIVNYLYVDVMYNVFVAQANDHEESPVRKSAVFCMVALHKAVGEERLAPYICKLAGSKQKLLRVYLSRTQGSSVPTSPKNSANN